MGISGVEILGGWVDEAQQYEDIQDEHSEHLTHIVNPPSNLHIWKQGMSAQEIVDIARAKGLQVVALCGKVWVPKRNPDKYDVCLTCVEIAAELMRGNNE